MVKSCNIKTDPRELNIYLDYNIEFCRCLKMREALSLTKAPVHTNPLSKENGTALPDTSIVHTTTPKTITENGASQKSSPEWSDLNTMLFQKAVF